MYAVMALQKNLKINGITVELNMNEHGMDGFIPVFDTKAKAEEWSDKYYQIIELKLKPEVKEGE